MSAKQVLSIGQCWADHGAISRTLQENFGAEVTGADSIDDALALLADGGFDLILVNRILDADGSSGVEVVRQLKADEKTRDVPVMLVSNHDDAQREARAAGAAPGFGKAALGTPAMLGRLADFLGGKAR